MGENTECINKELLKDGKMGMDLFLSRLDGAIEKALTTVVFIEIFTYSSLFHDDNRWFLTCVSANVIEAIARTVLLIEYNKCNIRFL